jgi:hypothetical protein
MLCSLLAYYSQHASARSLLSSHEGQAVSDGSDGSPSNEVKADGASLFAAREHDPATIKGSSNAELANAALVAAEVAHSPPQRIVQTADSRTETQAKQIPIVSAHEVDAAFDDRIACVAAVSAASFVVGNVAFHAVLEDAALLAPTPGAFHLASRPDDNVASGAAVGFDAVFAGLVEKGASLPWVGEADEKNDARQVAQMQTWVMPWNEAIDSDFS